MKGSDGKPTSSSIGSEKSLNEETTSVSRRQFIGAATGVAGATLLPGMAFGATTVSKTQHWDFNSDVVVVGSGAAGSCAALYAARDGAEVLMLEKASYYGGTTQKSQGAYWIPNNSLMRQRGLVDDRLDALKYMVRLSFPTLYQADHPTLGLAQAQFDLIAAYFDHGPRVVDELADMEVLQSTFFRGLDGSDFPDYYAHLEENKSPIGRILLPQNSDGQPGFGDELIRQLQAGVEKTGTKVRLNSRAEKLLLDDQGGVVGLLFRDKDHQQLAVRARKGVVFGSGGFIHNQQMRLDYLRGPVYGGCTVAGAEGDFVTMGAAAGAALGNMNNAWWAQILLEHAIVDSAVAMNVFVPPGDSMLQVNRYGQRFVNEKFVYNDRSQAHFVWDAPRAEYPNLFSFLIYDSQVAEKYAGVFPIPAGHAAYLLKGETLAELGQQITGRLAALSAHTGGYTLDSQFADNLAETVSRFNGFADKGVDPDFHRGEVPSELFFNNFYTPPGKPSDQPNPTMRRFADQGPYYAMILAPGVLDTKGGPKINTDGQVLDNYDQPIGGLYGAGNCIAAPAAQAYWSAGATIGAAMIFGALAGAHAANSRDS